MFAQFFVQVFMLPIIEYAGNGDKAAGIEAEWAGWRQLVQCCFLLLFLPPASALFPRRTTIIVKRRPARPFEKQALLIMLTLTVLVFITLSRKVVRMFIILIIMSIRHR
jgi:hypothetical protein